MYCVYVIQYEPTKEIYIGYTTDIKKRLINHNAGGTTSTKRKTGKWRLIYLEVYRTQADAKLRERRLKNHGSSKSELIKRIRSSLLET